MHQQVTRYVQFSDDALGLAWGIGLLCLALLIVGALVYLVDAVVNRKNLSVLGLAYPLAPERNAVGYAHLAADMDAMETAQHKAEDLEYEQCTFCPDPLLVDPEQSEVVLSPAQIEHRVRVATGMIQPPLPESYWPDESVPAFLRRQWL